MKHIESEDSPKDTLQNSYLAFLSVWEENTKSFIKKKPLLLNFILILWKETISNLNSIRQGIYAFLAGVSVLIIITLAFLTIEETIYQLLLVYLPVSEILILILFGITILLTTGSIKYKRK